MAATIAVLSQKGGTGKTTAVRTLTDVFRQAGLDVLVVDLDPQGNLSDYFDVDPEASPTVGDVLAGRAKAAAASQDGIIPANLALAEAELAMAGKMGRELILRKALKDVDAEHDIILIDCPPALGLLTVNSLVAYDSLKEHVGDKLLDTVVRQSIAYAESSERAISILEHRPDLGEDYVRLADEILGRLGLTAARQRVRAQLNGSR